MTVLALTTRPAGERADTGGGRAAAAPPATARPRAERSDTGGGGPAARRAFDTGGVFPRRAADTAGGAPRRAADTAGGVAPGGGGWRGAEPEAEAGPAAQGQAATLAGASCSHSEAPTTIPTIVNDNLPPTTCLLPQNPEKITSVLMVQTSPENTMTKPHNASNSTHLEASDRTPLEQTSFSGLQDGQDGLFSTRPYNHKTPNHKTDHSP